MGTRITVHDMNRVRLCELFDSEQKAEGQAYGVTLTTEISGWKEQSFTQPQTINGVRNFRWAFIRSGYLICVDRNGVKDWFLLNAPKRSHKGLAVTAAITCQHVCALLSKKNLYLTFDDTNGIGTAQYLLNQALANTGWTLAYCETFYEADGVTEKVRSLEAEEKRGAYLLIADICKLFSARPVFDGDSRTVSVYSLNRYEEMLEQNFGKNMDSIERKEDTENIVTRLYVEGEYSDSGYVGIDDVNPTGLPFLLNFDYFRDLGVFTQAHEQALADYLRDIQQAKAAGSAAMTRLLALENTLNELWGQITYVIYAYEDGVLTRTVQGGGASESQAEQHTDDTLTVLTPDGQHHSQTGWDFGEPIDYAVKFIQKPAARIGGKEVAIESKKLSIVSLRREMEQTADEGKRASLQEQIDALTLEIRAIYEGTETEDGLYAQMREAVETALALEDTRLAYQAALQSQQEIEHRFALAMGDMLIDGYWSNTNYAPGQEELLYLEACGVMERLSKPAVSYNVSIQNLSCVSGYEQEVFRIGMLLRIWDEALSLNDKAYISKLIEHLDAPEKDSVSITNDLTSIGAVSLDSILSQITGIADTVKQKKALYDRAKAISDNGSIPAQRLEGMIDVQKTRLSSSVSNWYTDSDGNLILESVNGSSAMKLCGEGFMIAGSRTDTGEWDWRTFGTGEGFTADMLVTGFLSADRIQAGTITANKLASDVGESLDLSSNESITLKVERTVEEAVGYRVELYTRQGDVLSDYVPSTTIQARVWHGNTEITNNLPASRFAWKRSSQDATADRIWNASHTGVKEITLTKVDVLFSATYSCEISDM